MGRYKAMDIARYIVDYCDEILQKPITNLQLQLILYCVWVDYYKQTGRVLFADHIYAWQLGPVVSKVYSTYCVYGGRPIHHLYEEKVLLCNSDEERIAKIVDKYAGVQVYDLVQRTHAKGGAWARIYDSGAGNQKKIPLDLIKRLECKRMADVGAWIRLDQSDR